uniref:G-protein coupled receptors family 3 profile domain-containing protein n=1 Tax=Vannella robusta TaxID=1487602 RepID=A0A7S4M7I9_9EUKA|mmetsp:Transcript_13811/g.17394  ORF Transcript_13811/g.17394 Transcript_13811/m.17394 type:complete len:288 (+) Transcript_13811:765-1628(+)
MIIYIVFGLLAGILILIAVVLLAFVTICGFLAQYQRMKVVSPTFLLIILLSIIIGISSIFAWYGKPHPVSCAFQPWLLGLSSISMIAALCAKTFRIWRIFRSEFVRQKITDAELLILWVVLMIPALVIIITWMIVSTPTAAMVDRDGTQHFICTTGGFTGEPGGYIFFGVLVGYGAIVLLLGVFLSIVTRKAPSTFNESKLLAISIYNLGFLSVVIVPVFLVVQQINPFIAWILRTSATLYAFTATMILQFLPICFGIVIVDHCKKKQMRVTANPSSQKNPSIPSYE